MELLVGLTLAGILLGSAVSLMGTLSRAVGEGMARWDYLEAVRTVWVTTERELRPGVPGRDWDVGADGVLRLRAFRGLGRVCGTGGEPGIHPVAWRGERLPVPGADSLLILGRDGGWRTAALEAWSEAESSSGGDATGCGADETERSGWMQWEGAGSEPPVLVRGFERGAYSIQAGAFRYARGEGGRQPLTPEIVASAEGYRRVGDGLVVELVPSLAGGRAPSFTPTLLRVRVQPQPTAGLGER